MADRRLRIVVEAINRAERELKELKRDLAGVEEGGQAGARGTKAFSGEAVSLKTIVGGILTANILQDLGRQIINVAQESIETASHIEEMEGKFDAVFRHTAPEVRDELALLAEELGRSRFELMEMAASVQDTFVPLGFAREQAAEMSLTLARLVPDVASFNDALDADVARDFQSALVGNTETVRKYGIVITEANTKQRAYELGLAEVGEELTDQQKVQTRLQMIIEGTTDAVGTAARESQNYAGLQRTAAAATEELVAALGEGFIPTAKDAKEAQIEFTRALLGPVQAWAKLRIAQEQGLISTFEANRLFAEMVFTGTDYNDVLEEMEEQLSFVDEATGDAVQTYDEYLIATTRLAEVKGELSDKERDALLLSEDLIESTDTQTRAMAENEQILDVLREKVGLTTRAQFELAFQQDLTADAAMREHDALRNVESASRDAAGAADDLEESTRNVAIAVGELTGAEIGRQFIQDLNRLWEDGAISEEEYISQMVEAQTMLLGLPADAVTAQLALFDLRQEWESGQIEIDEYLDLARDLKNTIEGIPTDKEVNIRVNTTYGSSGTGIGGIPEGYQTGGDFVVPPGFPNDSFPMFVSSGERVIVQTPAQQAANPQPAGGGGGPGVVLNIYPQRVDFANMDHWIETAKVLR